MSTNKTENLGLNQWVGSDPFRMTDFNEDNAKIDAAVAAKAEQTALDAETTARNAALASLTGRVDKKAEQTALDTLAGKVDKKAEQTALDTLAGKVDKKAEQTALTALTSRVGTLETNQLMWKYGTYTGKGTTGSTNANRLDFDFKPQMVIVYDNNRAGGYPWIRCGRGRVQDNESVFVTWGDKYISWYVNGTIENQLNISGRTYYYLAIGFQA